MTVHRHASDSKITRNIGSRRRDSCLPCFYASQDAVTSPTNHLCGHPWQGSRRTSARPAGLSLTSSSYHPGCPPARFTRPETGLAHRNGGGATTDTSATAAVFETAWSMPPDHAVAPGNAKTTDREPRSGVLVMDPCAQVLRPLQRPRLEFFDLPGGRPYAV